MKLLGFKIENYRSILDSGDIKLTNYNVIIGKNNEGKSNAVAALKLAFECFSFSFYRRYLRVEKIPLLHYSFSNDYPVGLQNKSDDYILRHPTKICLKFDFNTEEITTFFRETGIYLSRELDIEISFSKYRICNVKFLRKRFNDKYEIVSKLLSFIGNYYPFTLIQTVRTEEQSQKIINDIISKKLRGSLLHDGEYSQALQTIESKEKEVLDQITQDILPTLQKFVPTINSISLHSISGGVFERETGINDFEIDDGVCTSFEQKGDGIKSLLQIALLKFNANNNNGLLIVEEPESHLHSGAIHELNQVFQSISEQQQLIITSHNPIFVDTNNLNANIIVNSNKCEQAHSIRQIRKILGVEIADNLYTSDFVILVEGSSDKNFFYHFLPLLDESGKITKLLEENKVSILDCGGASKMEVYMNYFKSLLIKYYAIYDNDLAGTTAMKKAKTKNLIHEHNYYRLVGINDLTELEDLYKFDETAKIINDKYGVDISPYRAQKDKWSNKLKQAFIRFGKDFNEEIEEEIKDYLTSEMIKKPINEAFSDYTITNLKNLVVNILNFKNLK